MRVWVERWHSKFIVGHWCGIVSLASRIVRYPRYVNHEKFPSETLFHEFTYYSIVFCKHGRLQHFHIHATSWYEYLIRMCRWCKISHSPYVQTRNVDAELSTPYEKKSNGCTCKDIYPRIHMEVRTWKKIYDWKACIQCNVIIAVLLPLKLHFNVECLYIFFFIWTSMILFY